MRANYVIAMSIIITVLFTSCSSSNDVVSQRTIVKRKYLAGFHSSGLKLKKQKNTLVHSIPEEAHSKGFESKQVITKSSNQLEPSEIQTPSCLDFDTDNQVEDKHKLVRAPSPLSRQHHLHRVTKNHDLSNERISPPRETQLSESNNDDNMEVIALSVAILSIMLFAIPFINLILPALGVFFASKAMTNNPDSKIARVAKIVSVTSLILCGLYTLFYTAYIAFVILFLI